MNFEGGEPLGFGLHMQLYKEGWCIHLSYSPFSVDTLGINWLRTFLEKAALFYPFLFLKRSAELRADFCLGNSHRDIDLVLEGISGNIYSNSSHFMNGK